MRAFWGYDLHHIHTSFGKSLLGKFFDYYIKIIRTFIVILKNKPDELWIQLPPSLLLHVAFLYKIFFNRGCFIVADLHNSMLRNRWIKFPFALSLLNRVDVVLAHNSAVAEELVSIGVFSNKIRVLEDFPFKYEDSRLNSPAMLKGPYVIFPCSFDVDEPVWIVIEAARRIPIKFYITGDSAKFKLKDGDSLPENIVFTGYMSKPEYEDLLLNSTVVLGMTTRQNVQLSVANEGLSASKPLVLSNTRVLKDLYGEAAIFVSNESSDDLVEKFKYVLSNLDEMSEATSDLLTRRVERWKNQAAQVHLK